MQSQGLHTRRWSRDPHEGKKGSLGSDEGRHSALTPRQGGPGGHRKTVRSNISCFVQNPDTENRPGYGKLQLAGVSTYMSVERAGTTGLLLSKGSDVQRPESVAAGRNEHGVVNQLNCEKSETSRFVINVRFYLLTLIFYLSFPFH